MTARRPRSVLYRSHQLRSPLGQGLSQDSSGLLGPEPASCRHVCPSPPAVSRARMQPALGSCSAECSGGPAQQYCQSRPSCQDGPGWNLSQGPVASWLVLGFSKCRWQFPSRPVAVYKSPPSQDAGQSTQVPEPLPKGGGALVAKGWALGSDRPGLESIICCILSA